MSDYDSDDESTIIVGSGSNKIEYVVCDTTNYFVCGRTKELEHISNNISIFNFESLKTVLFNLFPYLTDLYKQNLDKEVELNDMHIYKFLIDKSGMYDVMALTTIDLYGKLKYIDSIAVEKINKHIMAKKHGRDIMVRFPTITKRPILKKEMKYNPDELHKFINTLINHIREYNVDALTGKKFHLECLKKIDPFTLGMYKHENIKISQIKTVDDIIETMKKLNEREITMSKYLEELEKYQREIMATINLIEKLMIKIMKKIDK